MEKNKINDNMSMNNITKIILDISTNPNSNINKISKRTNTLKSSVKRIVEILNKEGILIKNNDNYCLSNILSNNAILERTDVFFNLNFPKETKEKIYTLFKIIEETWIELTGKKPSKIQMQKTFVEVNYEFKIGLPTGWYRFGEISPISYNSEIKYEKYFTDIIPNFKKLLEIIGKNVFLTPKQAKEKQYLLKEDNFNKLYLLKEEFYKNITENKIENIYNKYNEFLKLIKHVDDKVVDKFYEFLVYYLRLEEDKKNHYTTKFQLYKIFDIFWKIIAIYNYRYSLDDYYTKNKLNKNDLNTKLLLDLNINKIEFNDVLDEFYDSFKITDFYNDPETKKLISKVLK